jgi:FKBP-type peptidyl-prolyl cis-trans isomerase
MVLLRMRKFLFLLIIPFCFFGCKQTDQAAVDKQIILKYIADHNLNAIEEPNGLYYVPTVVGTGGYPNINSTVTVYYKGYFTNGNVFDQTTISPIAFPLANVITGWQEGIPLMQTGGKATLLIPSALAYGSQGAGSVPGNTVLIFDVQLVSFH